MQRKPTSNTRGPNAAENKFVRWVKEQDCIVSGAPGPSIAHHCEGATFKHNKVLVGHWFVIPLCQEIDDVVTRESRRAFRERFGTQSSLWIKLIEKSPYDPPYEVMEAIRDWNK